jgi:hypothetical protein
MTMITTILCMAIVLALGVLGVVYFGIVSFKEFHDLLNDFRKHNYHSAL